MRRREPTGLGSACLTSPANGRNRYQRRLSSRWGRVSEVHVAHVSRDCSARGGSKPQNPLNKIDWVICRVILNVFAKLETIHRESRMNEGRRPSILRTPPGPERSD